MSHSHNDTPGAASATVVRRWVLGITALTAVLLYLDRFCMAFAQRYVKEDLGLSDAQIDTCMSVFFLSYGLAQVPAGGLTDRFGSRAMLTIYILAWSFFTASMGWVGGFVGLVAVRLAAGVSQAGAYPTGARVVGQWAPLSQRGAANSLIALGGRVGGALAPPLTAALIVAFVPLTVSPLLTQSDLLDANTLSGQLVAATDPSLNPDLATDQRARAELIYSVRTQFETQDGWSAIARMAEASDESTTAAGRDALVAQLNRFIDGALLTRIELLEQVKLENEAKPLIVRRDSLSDAERQRLNRLILEAVFPASIRKLYVHGWRPVMFWYGLAGVLVAAWFFWQVRDRPNQHPRVNAAELELLAGSGAPATTATAESIPIGAILASRSLWLLSIAACGTTFGWTFLVSLLDRYLDTVHGVPFIERGWMQSIPLFVGWVGMAAGGWWTDWLTRRRGIKIGRAVPFAFSRFVAMAAFLLMLLHPSPWVCIVLLSAVAFGTDLGSPAIWSICQDVGGRSVATVLGWGNMWGNIGGFAAPMLLGWVSRQWNWDVTFVLCALSFWIAGTAALFVDATQPVTSRG
ncbi:MAG: MFS transporter [Planctomycetaceae bacterium]|nr:MFS transporter [Planctomycetaceae bacterium]